MSIKSRLSVYWDIAYIRVRDVLRGYSMEDLLSGRSKLRNGGKQQWFLSLTEREKRAIRKQGEGL